MQTYARIRQLYLIQYTKHNVHNYTSILKNVICAWFSKWMHVHAFIVNGVPCIVVFEYGYQISYS